MSERDPRNPDLRAVEEDFSTPADPDLRGPGNDDYTTPGDPLTGTEHAGVGDEERVAKRATPGNPLTGADEVRSGGDGTLAGADYTTPGDPLTGAEREGEVAEEEETARTATPGNPIEEN